jgi:hypothetical protein
MNLFNRNILLIAGMLTVFFCIGPAALALAPEIEAQIQPTKALTITFDNRSAVWSLRPNVNPNQADYVILEVEAPKLESDMIDILYQWVQSGKGLLVGVGDGHSTWLHPHASSLGKPHRTGNQSMRGRPVTIPKLHPICYGISQVNFPSYDFIGIGIVHKRYFMNQDPTSVLRPLITSQDGLVLLAVQDLGSGRIAWLSGGLVSAPIMQNRKYLGEYDNKRLAVNLDQWLAGYPVPGLTLDGQDIAPAQNETALDMVNLVNGDVLRGYIQNEHVGIRTTYAALQFQMKDVLQLGFEGFGNQTDYIRLRSGDRLSGVIGLNEWRLALLSGSMVTLEKSKIKEITISVRNRQE